MPAFKTELYDSRTLTIQLTVCNLQFCVTFFKAECRNRWVVTVIWCRVCRALHAFCRQFFFVLVISVLSNTMQYLKFASSLRNTIVRGTTCNSIKLQHSPKLPLWSFSFWWYWKIIADYGLLVPVMVLITKNVHLSSKYTYMLRMWILLPLTNWLLNK